MAFSPGRRIALAAAAVALVFAVLLVVVVVLAEWSATGASDDSMGDVDCAVPGVSLTGANGGLGLDDEQIRDAQIIVATGQLMHVPVKGEIVAIAAALQESGLRNLDHGDRDSLGLFQERPSQGWGSRAQVMDPQYAASQFYAHLLKVDGWQEMSVNDAAQAVERSGYPTAYAKHEQQAVQIVAAVYGTTGVQQVDVTGCASQAAPSSALVSGIISSALQQTGKPYKWGGTGPDAFDCSGLIVFAYRQNGVQLPVRTSQQMYAIATTVPSGKEQLGDLAFSEFGKGGPKHVMLVVKPGLLVEAPHTGADVRVRAYNAKTERLKFGRLP